MMASTQTSPSAHSISGAGTQSLTITSLRGSYLYVVVQVTRDSVPVVFSQWRLPESAFSLGVCDVTLEQFEALAERMGRSVDLSMGLPVTDWSALVSNKMMSLAQLLMVNPIRFEPGSQDRCLLISLPIDFAFDCRCLS